MQNAKHICPAGRCYVIQCLLNVIFFKFGFIFCLFVCLFVAVVLVLVVVVSGGGAFFKKNGIN